MLWIRMRFIALLQGHLLPSSFPEDSWVNGVCRGLILLHPVGTRYVSMMLKRFTIPSNMLYCQQGVIELDPYSCFALHIVASPKNPLSKGIPLRVPLFDTTLQFIIAAVLCILCVLFAILIVNLFTFHRLRPHSKTQAITQIITEPLISVLVPARNEEQSIERCVRSLVAQTYEQLEILVLDDSSSDATATIVQRVIDELPLQQQGRLGLLQGKALPIGWSGKNFACHQLAQHASGEYLFFTDADTVHLPKMVTSVLNCMKQRDVSLLTAQPTYELGGLGERLVVPLLTFTIMTLLPVALIPVRPEPSLATGNGQLLCFERSAYKKIGGHESVKNHILEDVLLARAIKAAGFRMLFVDARDLVRCRMYRSFKEVWSGFSKNLFAFYNYALPFALVGLLLNVLLFLVPPLLVIAGLFVPLPYTTLLLALGAYVLAVLMRVLLTLRFTHKDRSWTLLLCLLHPVSIALECLILVNSIWWHYRKEGTVWKGRQYVT